MYECCLNICNVIHHVFAKKLSKLVRYRESSLLRELTVLHHSNNFIVYGNCVCFVSCGRSFFTFSDLLQNKYIFAKCPTIGALLHDKCDSFLRLIFLGIFLIFGSVYFSFTPIQKYRCLKMSFKGK